MTDYIYTYKVIRESAATGERAKRSRTLLTFKPLTVGGLYCHLGVGYPGFQRILELVSKEEIKEE